MQPTIIMHKMIMGIELSQVLVILLLRIFMIPIQIGDLNRNLHHRFYFIRHSLPLALV